MDVSYDKLDRHRLEAVIALCSGRRDWFFSNADGLKLEVISLEVHLLASWISECS